MSTLARFLQVGFLVALAAGCKFTGSSDSVNTSIQISIPLRSLQLQPAAGCEAYRGYVADSLVQSMLDGGYYPPRLWGSDANGGPSASSPVAHDQGSVSGSANPSEVSHTNVQEEGVDEADPLQVDAAGRLYIFQGRYLVIAQGYPPAELRELSRLDLGGDGVSDVGLYLDEPRRRLVVIKHHYPSPSDGAADVPFNATEIAFVNIADPTAPVVTGRLYLEGYYAASRRVDHRIHLVSGSYLSLPMALQDDANFWEQVRRYSGGETSDDLKNRITETVRAAVNAMPLQELLPRSLRRDADGKVSDAGLLSCGQVLMPEVRLYPGFMTVASFDTDGTDAAATAIVNNAWQVYGSREHLYLAQTSGGWWWGEDKAVQTAIYQFDIGDAQPVYRATGSVPGWPLSAYSYSKHEGYLRVVTTETTSGNDGRLHTRHALTVLRDDGQGTLAQTGAVSGFGADESVRAVRYVGERAYVVTFRNIDPLFAFDLSDPAAPRVAGELEIPGFSTYMHPIDERHLLTIGSDGVSGMQLQLFDVGDLAQPRLLHRYALGVPAGYTSSTAQYDPHAFTYYAPRGLLAVPLSIWSDDSPAQSFNGVAAFHVDVSDGIRALGRIDHTDLAYQALCKAAKGDPNRPYFCDYGGYVSYGVPSRSVVMAQDDETYLYTVSDVGVKASTASTPGQVLGVLPLPVQMPTYEPLPLMRTQ